MKIESPAFLLDEEPKNELDSGRDILKGISENR